MRAPSVLATLCLGCAPDVSLAPKPDDLPADSDGVVDSDPVDTDTDLPDTDTDDTDPPEDSAPADTDTIDPPVSTDASTVGTVFWLGFMENIELLFNGTPSMAVVVSSEVAATGSVDVQFTGLSLPFTLAPGEVQEIRLPAATWYGSGSGAITNQGLRISADAPISAWAVHYRLYFTDATLLLPEEELGHDYVVFAHPDDDISHPSEFVVVATTDDTVLLVTPSTLTTDARPAGVTFQVPLDAGQTWQLQAFGDLSGTRVRTQGGELIAVFGGAQRAEVGGGTCSPDNTLWDQVPRLDRLGTDYTVAPFSGQGGDLVKVVATQDGTSVQRDCGTPILLDAGETSAFRVSAPERITSDKPILVGQFNTSQSCNTSRVGDPSMQILQPSQLVRKQVTFESSFDPAFQRASAGGMGPSITPHFVNVTAPSTLTSLTVDGVERVGELTPLPGFPTTLTGQLSVSAGPHALVSDVGVNAHAYGFFDFDAYTVHLGYDCEGCATGLGDPTTCP